jgi:hypothetical protein
LFRSTICVAAILAFRFSVMAFVTVLRSLPVERYDDRQGSSAHTAALSGPDLVSTPWSKPTDFQSVSL